MARSLQTMPGSKRELKRDGSVFVAGQSPVISTLESVVFAWRRYPVHCHGRHVSPATGQSSVGERSDFKVASVDFLASAEEPDLFRALPQPPGTLSDAGWYRRCAAAGLRPNAAAPFRHSQVPATSSLESSDISVSVRITFSSLFAFKRAELVHRRDWSQALLGLSFFRLTWWPTDRSPTFRLKLFSSTPDGKQLPGKWRQDVWENRLGPRVSHSEVKI
jgi:hypothetical protein